jgi:hypothetical protein
VDIVLLLNAVAGLEALVGKVVTAVGTWRDKGRADDEARQALTEDLANLRKGLAAVDGLARSATAYIDLRDETHRLLVHCITLKNYVSTDQDQLRKHLTTSYQDRWRAVDAMLDSMAQNTEACRRQHLQRGRWYDATDSEAIGSRLADFDRAFAQCAAFATSQDVDGVERALDDMQRPLELVDTLLKDTLQEKILGGLTQIRDAA